MRVFRLPALLIGAYWSAAFVENVRYSETNPACDSKQYSLKKLPKDWDHCSEGETLSKLNEILVHSPRAYCKRLIFVRHGQYNLKGRTPDDKVLTERGWLQAYNTGCYLRKSGIRIDRIVHSNMIRARQTTAGLLIGLQPGDCDSLLDWPVLTTLATPSSSVADPMLGAPYQPYPDAPFDCQESRFLAEGSPPIAPEPPTRNFSADRSQLTDARRLDQGFYAHVHRIPVTERGFLSILLHPEFNPATHSLASSTHAHMEPCETVVFVGHANVFRFWLCRALQLPAESWLRFSLHHGSITSLVIQYNPAVSSRHCGDSEREGNGKCSVSAARIGEVGHLPRHLLSF